jgi:hypothetical protein
MTSKSPRSAHWSRCVAAVLAVAIAAIISMAPPAADAASKASKPAAAPSSTLNGLKLVSYYPADGSWTGMWNRWSQTTIDADFARIAALRANAVRIVVFPSVFGYPTPSPLMTQRLAATVNTAQAHGLKVAFTLFDWWGGYDDIAGSKVWASAILQPYVSDSRVAFVELKNEIDPYDGAAMAWARALLPYVQSQQRTTPVTISTSAGLERLSALKNALGPITPSFWDYHYYGDGNGDAAGAQAVLQQAKTMAAPLPLYIGETGLSTSFPVGVDPATAEAQQDHFLRTVQQATINLGLPPASVWTLNDVVRGTEEYGFGLFRGDGSAKPAAASITSFFGTRTIAAPLAFTLEWRQFDAIEGQLALDSSVRRNGPASARLAHTTGGPYGVPSFVMSPIDAFIAPSKTATITAYAQSAASSGQNTIALVWFSATGQYLGQSESAALANGTTPWTRLSVTGMAPPNTAFVQLAVKSAMNAGTVWFDDVTYAHN